LRKRVCATPEDDIAATSVFISRSASPTPRSIPPSPVALQARQPCRETRTKENGLFYALSFVALRDVVTRRRSSPHRLAAPVSAFAAFAGDAVSKGLATHEELEFISRSWREWADSEEGWLAMPHGEILARA